MSTFSASRVLRPQPSFSGRAEIARTVGVIEFEFQLKPLCLPLILRWHAAHVFDGHKIERMSRMITDAQ